MKRRGLCTTLLVVASLAMICSAAAQAKTPIAARDIGGRATWSNRAPSADFAAVPYGGGPVLRWNRTHLIFWAPSNSNLTFDPGYESLIETFLHNVAAASHSTNNVYGLTGQYRDQNGPATYASVYGGAVTASDPAPPNGCTNPPSAPPWSVCLTDAQLQHEIERVVRRDHLPRRLNDLYFLVTPNGFGTCEFSGSENCALGGDVSGFCGYHSQTNDGLVLYAVIPYNAVGGHCQSGNPRPNGNAADPTISTISHEQSEMITDPLGNAWINQNTAEEVGDLCLTSFGNPIGGSGNSAWNETINGGHYFLQEEWSNRNGGCEPRALSDWVWFGAGLHTAHPLSVAFSGHGFDPEGKLDVFRWFFGDGGVGTGRRPVHRYAHPGRYRVALRTTDSWGNWTLYAATVSVARSGVRLLSLTNAG